MDMLKQAAEQMLTNTAAQMANLPQMVRGQKAESAPEGKDFDSLVRQKYQEAEKTEKPKDAREQTTETQEAEKPAQKAGPVRKDPAAEEEQPGEGQQLLAAAMMLQRPIVPVEEPVQVQEEAVAPVAAQAQAEAVVAVEAQPEQAQTEAQPQQQVRQTEQPETAAPAVEQRQVREADRRPEQEQEAGQATQVEVRNVRRQDHRTPQNAEVKVEQTGQQRKDEDETEETVSSSVERPLFDHVEAVPFKVAATQAKPVEVNAPDAAEQLAGRISSAEQAGLSHIELTLAPENLGRLTVEITRTQAGALSIVMHAADPKAATVLERHSSNLQQLLAANTQNEVRVEVRGNEESQRQFLNPDDGQNRQGQQQGGHQQRRGHEHTGSQDFVQQLRLGLIDLENNN